MGSYFYDLVVRGGADDAKESSDYQDAKNLLDLAHFFSDILEEDTDHADQSITAHLSVLSKAKGSESQGTTIQVPLYSEQVQSKSKILTSTSSTFGERKGHDRIDVKLPIHERFTERLLQKLQQVYLDSSQNSSLGILPPPWFDNDGLLVLDVMQLYIVQVLSYIAENPGASLIRLHANIIILNIESLERLLELLVKHKVLVERSSTVSIKLSNPFDKSSYLSSKAVVTQRPGYQQDRWFDLCFECD